MKGDEATAPVALRVEDLSAGYGDLKVLRGVSLTVAKGQTVVIIGPNGAGKTTLLRAIAGVIPAAGSITVGTYRPRRQWTPEALLKHGLALVPSGRGTFSHLTVTENLLVGGMTLSQSAARREANEWLTFFPRLGERAELRAGLLSGGEQQILAIVRALMARPDLLLLDEPSLGLAPRVVEQVYDVLAQLQRERRLSLLLVEQALGPAVDLSEHAYLLDSGTIVRSGSPAELMSDEQVRKTYLGY